MTLLIDCILVVNYFIFPSQHFIYLRICWREYRDYGNNDKLQQSTYVPKVGDHDRHGTKLNDT